MIKVSQCTAFPIKTWHLTYSFWEIDDFCLEFELLLFRFSGLWWKLSSNGKCMKFPFDKNNLWNYFLIFLTNSKLVIFIIVIFTMYAFFNNFYLTNFGGFGHHFTVYKTVSRKWDYQKVIVKYNFCEIKSSNRGTHPSDVYICAVLKTRNLNGNSRRK